LFFVKSDKLDSAIRIASFRIKKDEWKIIDWQQSIQVSRQFFLHREEGLKVFGLAEIETISTLYVGVDDLILNL
jgi:hypothetical protein